MGPRLHRVLVHDKEGIQSVDKTNKIPSLATPFSSSPLLLLDWPTSGTPWLTQNAHEISVILPDPLSLLALSTIRPSLARHASFPRTSSE